MTWIKPSELPPKFHGKCFIVNKHWFDNVITSVEIVTVQNYYRGTTPEMWSENHNYWEYISDDRYRVVVVEYPDKPEKI